MVILLMGVSGSGKTTVGLQLGAALGWSYHDADDYHPAANVAKMAAGEPLTDADRQPWLQALRTLICRWVRAGESVILGCSALKQQYRDVLTGGLDDVVVVHLSGSRQLIASRLSTRQHRYMPASLLDSQFADLEAPQDAVTVDIGPSPDRIAAEIRRRLGL